MCARPWGRATRRSSATTARWAWAQARRSALDASILTERAAKIFVLSSILGRPGTLPDDVVASEAAIFEMRRTARRGENALAS